MTTPVPVKSPSVPVPGRWQTRVLLRSNEGDGYEIDRQVPMDGSVFFRNLFNLPKPNEPEQDGAAASDATPSVAQSGEGIVSPKFEDPEDGLILDEEINIDATTKDLKLFADLMQHIIKFNRLVQAQNIELTLEEAVILLTLTDKYDCVNTRTAVLKRIAHLAGTKPWEVLYIACDWDDLWMGRKAIAQPSDRLVHIAAPDTEDPNIWARLAPLGHVWQVAFLRLYMPATMQGINYQTHMRTPTLGVLDSNFATWAKNFDPKKA